jgi:N-acetylneuraminic acid mutarotase
MRFFVIFFLIIILPLALFAQELNHWVKKSTDGFTIRDLPSSVIYNNKIYVFGADSLLVKVEVYDPTTDTWATLPTTGNYAQQVFFLGSTSFVNDKMYLNADQGSAGTRKEITIFDPLTNTWSIPDTIHGRFYIS